MNPEQNTIPEPISPEQQQAIQSQLKAITERFLNPDLAKPDMPAVAQELLGFYHGLSPIQVDYDNPRYKYLEQVKHGKGLSPECAGGCILDSVRTARYLQAGKAAIDAALEKFDAPVQVLYAGCGPFAPLMLPLLPLYTPEQVQLTLVDIFEDSIRSVARVAESCGLAPYIRRAHLGDAAGFEPDGKYHILVMEVLQRALEKEPQVALTRVLAPHIAAGGFLIPEEVRVYAYIGNVDEHFPPKKAPRPADVPRHHLGDVFSLTKDSLGDVTFEEIVPGAERIRARTIEVGEFAVTDYMMMLGTDITLFGEYKIEEGESGLTEPFVLHNMGPFAAGDTVEIDYILDNFPIFEAKVRRPAGSGLISR